MPSAGHGPQRAAAGPLGTAASGTHLWSTSANYRLPVPLEVHRMRTDMRTGRLLLLIVICGSAVGCGSSGEGASQVVVGTDLIGQSSIIVVTSGGGTIGLAGVVQVAFAPATFAGDTPVSLSATRMIETGETLAMSFPLSDSPGIFACEFRLNTGSAIPEQDVSVAITLPDELAALVTEGYAARACIQDSSVGLADDGVEEGSTEFFIADATYDPIDHVLRTTIEPGFFAAAALPPGTFEAVLWIAVVPSGEPDVGADSLLQGGSPCPQVGAPLPGLLVVKSAYGYRDDPMSTSERQFHRGLDLKADENTPVLAVAAGHVADLGWQRAGGYWIRLRHGEGASTFYSSYLHLSALPLIAKGQPVQQGVPIALSGRTGERVTGPHLCFKLMRRNWDTFDPAPCLGLKNDNEDPWYQILINVTGYKPLLDPDGRATHESVAMHYTLAPDDQHLNDDWVTGCFMPFWLFEPNNVLRIWELDPGAYALDVRLQLLSAVPAWVLFKEETFGCRNGQPIVVTGSFNRLNFSIGDSDRTGSLAGGTYYNWVRIETWGPTGAGGKFIGSSDSSVEVTLDGAPIFSSEVIAPVGASIAIAMEGQTDEPMQGGPAIGMWVAGELTVVAEYPSSGQHYTLNETIRIPSR